jgi:tetratricopeptide (TPR) repeat protein
MPKNQVPKTVLYVGIGMAILAISLSIFVLTEPVKVVQLTPEEILAEGPEELAKLDDEQLIQYGDYFTNKRMYGESTIFYDTVLTRNGNDIRALNGAGYSLSKMEKFEDAINHFSHVLAMESFNVNANNGMGTAYIGLEKYDDAISYFEKSIKKNPRNANGYNGLATAQFYLKEYDESENNFQKSLDWNPRKVETYNGLALLLLNTGNVTGAEQVYRHALDLSGNNPDSLVGIGTILLSRGQTDEGNLMLDQARQVDLEAVNTMFVQAKRFVEIQKNEEALMLIESVLRFEPTNKEALELRNAIKGM